MYSTNQTTTQSIVNHHKMEMKMEITINKNSLLKKNMTLKIISIYNVNVLTTLAFVL